MIRQWFFVDTGIRFYLESFKDVGLNPSTLFPVVTLRPPSLKPSGSTIVDVKAFAHAAEPTDATPTDEVHAPPAAVSAFKSEEDEELIDALCQIYDQLKLAKALVDSRDSSFALLFAELKGLELEAPSFCPRAILPTSAKNIPTVDTQIRYIFLVEKVSLHRLCRTNRLPFAYRSD
jgi:hypothetical protein